MYASYAEYRLQLLWKSPFCIVQVSHNNANIHTSTTSNIQKDTFVDSENFKKIYFTHILEWSNISSTLHLFLFFSINCVNKIFSISSLIFHLLKKIMYMILRKWINRLVLYKCYTWFKIRLLDSMRFKWDLLPTCLAFQIFVNYFITKAYLIISYFIFNLNLIKNVNLNLLFLFKEFNLWILLLHIA